MKKLINISALTAITFTIIACGNSTSKVNSAIKAIALEQWDNSNDPLKIDPALERNYSKLPIEGKLDVTLWSDSYWPSKEGGIAARWVFLQEDQLYNFHYESPTLEALKTMSPRGIAILSPAEKFDIYSQNYGYPTVNFERWRNNPKAKRWEGLGHGWAAATLNFKEPKAVVVENADGIRISFGSSDLKALLAFYLGEITNIKPKYLGLKCETNIEQHPAQINSPECKGVNAASFHLILANMIGINKTGLVADFEKRKEVSSYPIFGFSSRIQGINEFATVGATKGTTQELIIVTTINTRSPSEALWYSTMDGDTYNKETEYKYRLELNNKGNIIGGTWLSDNPPNFLWTQAKPKFTGKYKILEKLVDNSNEAAVDARFPPRDVN